MQIIHPLRKTQIALQVHSHFRHPYSPEIGATALLLNVATLFSETMQFQLAQESKREQPDTQVEKLLMENIECVEKIIREVNSSEKLNTYVKRYDEFPAKVNVYTQNPEVRDAD